jgi:minor extracellular serine protease Vpr
MVQIDKAILAATKITPGKLSLGESEAGATTHALTIENKGGEAVTYDLSYVNALSTGGSTFDPGYFLGNAAVTFSSASVSVPAGGSATVEATVHPATGPALGQYGGYIVFTPQDGGQVYRVPYAGFVGDYQEIEVLTDGGAGLPLVGRATSCVRIVDGECIGGNYDFPADDYVYDMSSVFEQPSILVHLDHQARRLRAQVFDANTGRSWHRAFDFEYLARNSGPTSFFAFGWDGTTWSGNRGYEVPNGQYVIELSVLNALGDSDNPAHWETWTSPVITIERP